MQWAQNMFNNSSGAVAPQTVIEVQVLSPAGVSAPTAVICSVSQPKLRGLSREGKAGQGGRAGHRERGGGGIRQQ